MNDKAERQSKDEENRLFRDVRMLFRRFRLKLSHVTLIKQVLVYATPGM